MWSAPAMCPIMSSPPPTQQPQLPPRHSVRAPLYTAIYTSIPSAPNTLSPKPRPRQTRHDNTNATTSSHALRSDCLVLGCIKEQYTRDTAILRQDVRAVLHELGEVIDETCKAARCA